MTVNKRGDETKRQGAARRDEVLVRVMLHLCKEFYVIYTRDRSLWVEPTAEMEEMKNMVHDIQLSDCKDMVAWKIGTNNFLVKRVFIYKSKQVMWLVIGKFGNLKCPSRLKYSCGY